MLKSGIEQTVAIIKLDGMSAVFDGKAFPTLFEERLQNSKIDIIDVFKLTLDEEGLRKIFPVLNLPSDFGEGWKYDFIEHMQTGDLQAYLLSCKNAFSSVTAIKKNLRVTLLQNNQDYMFRVIKNLLHTCDAEDFEITLKTIYEYKEKYAGVGQK